MPSAATASVLTPKASVLLFTPRFDRDSKLSPLLLLPFTPGSGTSMATPLVSAAATMLFNAGSGLGYAQVKSLLLTTVDPFTNSGFLASS